MSGCICTNKELVASCVHPYCPEHNRDSAMRVWRVHNGYMAACPVHRIVIASDREDAIATAAAFWMKPGQSWDIDAEEIEFSNGIETTSYEG